MGIPESITHAIEQLPVGESLNSTRYGGNVQRVCKLGDAKVKKGKFCTRAKCGSSDSAQEPSVAHQILHLHVFLVLCFLHLAFSLLVFRNAAALLHKHTVNWRVFSLTWDETTSVRTSL